MLLRISVFPQAKYTFFPLEFIMVCSTHATARSVSQQDMCRRHAIFIPQISIRSVSDDMLSGNAGELVANCTSVNSDATKLVFSSRSAFVLFAHRLLLATFVVNSNKHSCESPLAYSIHVCPIRFLGGNALFLPNGTYGIQPLFLSYSYINSVSSWFSTCGFSSIFVVYYSISEYLIIWTELFTAYQ